MRWSGGMGGGGTATRRTKTNETTIFVRFLDKNLEKLRKDAIFAARYCVFYILDID